jgi:hypothetical protein
MPLRNAGNVFGHGKSNVHSVGFTAWDNGKNITVSVLDPALDALENSRFLPDYKAACEKHLGRLLMIASAKYDSGLVESDGSLLLTLVDVERA